MSIVFSISFFLLDIPSVYSFEKKTICWIQLWNSRARNASLWCKGDRNCSKRWMYCCFQDAGKESEVSWRFLFWSRNFQILNILFFRILFRTRNLVEVKEYLQRQWMNIMTGNISLHDLVIATEVRLGDYKYVIWFRQIKWTNDLKLDRKNGPPSARVASERMKADPRDRPQYRERIKWVRTANNRYLSPLDAAENPNIQLDLLYYVRQTIRALRPVFWRVNIGYLISLLHLIMTHVLCFLFSDISTWFKEMKLVRASNRLAWRNEGKKKMNTLLRAHKQSTMDQHQGFVGLCCLVCGGAYKMSQEPFLAATQSKGMCHVCTTNPQHTSVSLITQIDSMERKYSEIELSLEYLLILIGTNY